MKDLFALFLHLLTAIAKLLGPGGTKAVLAETLLVKHQLLITHRLRRRAPNLTPRDRIVMGLLSLLMSPNRIHKTAIVPRPTTLLKFHQALKQHKYRLLFSPEVSPDPCDFRSAYNPDSMINVEVFIDWAGKLVSRSEN